MYIVLESRFFRFSKSKIYLSSQSISTIHQILQQREVTTSASEMKTHFLRNHVKKRMLKRRKKNQTTSKTILQSNESWMKNTFYRYRLIRRFPLRIEKSYSLHHQFGIVSSFSFTQLRPPHLLLFFLVPFLPHSSSYSFFFAAQSFQAY